MKSCNVQGASNKGRVVMQYDDVEVFDFDDDARKLFDFMRDVLPSGTMDAFALLLIKSRKGVKLES